MSVKITEKMTFSQANEEIDALRNNGDLSNLAHALMNIREAEAGLHELKEKIHKIAARIEGGNLVPVGIVKKLYDKARDARFAMEGEE